MNRTMKKSLLCLTLLAALCAGTPAVRAGAAVTNKLREAKDRDKHGVFTLGRHCGYQGRYFLYISGIRFCKNQ